MKQTIIHFQSERSSDTVQICGVRFEAQERIERPLRPPKTEGPPKSTMKAHSSFVFLRFSP